MSSDDIHYCEIIDFLDDVQSIKNFTHIGSITWFWFFCFLAPTLFIFLWFQKSDALFFLETKVQACIYALSLNGILSILVTNIFIAAKYNSCDQPTDGGRTFAVSDIEFSETFVFVVYWIAIVICTAMYAMASLLKAYLGIDFDDDDAENEDVIQDINADNNPIDSNHNSNDSKTTTSCNCGVIVAKIFIVVFSFAVCGIFEQFYYVGIYVESSVSDDSAANSYCKCVDAKVWDITVLFFFAFIAPFAIYCGKIQCMGTSENNYDDNCCYACMEEMEFEKDETCTGCLIRWTCTQALRLSIICLGIYGVVILFVAPVGIIYLRILSMIQSIQLANIVWTAIFSVKNITLTITIGYSIYPIIMPLIQRIMIILHCINCTKKRKTDDLRLDAVNSVNSVKLCFILLCLRVFTPTRYEHQHAVSGLFVQDISCKLSFFFDVHVFCLMLID